MRVTVLGSGDAFNAGGSLHSCYLLEHEGGRVMMDAGPTVLASLKRLGLRTDLPDAVLVSHLHGDHFAGIPYLFLEYSFVNCRTAPLKIVGPEKIEDHVDAVYAALYGGLQSRELSFPVEYVEVEPGRPFELAGFRCTPFRAEHRAGNCCLGYRVESPEGSLLYSGDSAWTEEFVTHSRGVDLFLCECTSFAAGIPRHTSYEEILARRDRLGCKRLMLTHLGPGVCDADALEIERVHDGLVIEI